MHYTLGLTPYRNGGLTKYYTDLMLEQISLRHKISLLYPNNPNYTYPNMRINKNIFFLVFKFLS